MSSDLLTELKRRRILQIVGIYLGGAWVALEFSSWLVERYGLGERVTDAILVAMITLLPTVLLLAWNHGAEGREDWSKVERFAIPANVIVAVFAVSSLFYGETQPAHADGDQISGLLAAPITAEITPNATAPTPLSTPTVTAQRGLVYFSVTEGDTPTWWSQASALLIARDVDQHPQLISESTYTRFEWGVISRLRRVDMHERSDLPLTLMTQVARDLNYDWFVRTTVSEDDGRTTINGQLIATNDSQTMLDIEASGDTLFEAVDAVTAQIRSTLFDDAEAVGEDLPIRALTTPSMAALEAFIVGRNARLMRNDSQTAAQQYMAAVDTDPDFALAKMAMADEIALLGATDAAAEQFEALSRRDFGLLSGEQMYVKARSYELLGQPDKQYAVYKLWAEMSPDSWSAWISMGLHELWGRQDYAAALVSLERAAALSPGQSWLLGRLAETAAVLGQNERALQYLQQAKDNEPTDHSPWVIEGNLRLLLGELDIAEAAFQRAAIMRQDVVSPRIGLSDVAIRRGDLDTAFDYLDDASKIAKSPIQLTLVNTAQGEMAKLIGQQDSAAKLFEAAYISSRTHTAPAFALINQGTRAVFETALAGEQDEARRLLDSGLTVLADGIALLTDAGELYLEAGSGDCSGSAARWAQMQTDHAGDPLLLALNPQGAIAMCWLVAGQASQAAAGFDEELATLDTRLANAESRQWITRYQAWAARAHRLAGNVEEAQRLVDEVLSVFPSHPIALIDAAALAATNDPTRSSELALRAATFLNQADDGYDLLAEARSLVGERVAELAPAEG